MAPARYRRRPVEVDAMRWDGTAAGATPIIDWVLAKGSTARYHDDDGGLPAHIVVEAALRTFRVGVGDFVVLTEEAGFRMIPATVFGAMFEEATK